MLMMLLLMMNMLIAILMDGYANAKGLAESPVEEAMRFNVGPLLPHLKRQVHAKFNVFCYELLLRLYQHGWTRSPPATDAKWAQWSDPVWIAHIDQVMARLRQRKENPRSVEVPAFAQTCCWVLARACMLVRSRVSRDSLGLTWGLLVPRLQMRMLIMHLVVVSGCDRSEVIKQVYHQFQERRFRRPTDPNRPFEEPDTEKRVTDMSSLIKDQVCLPA